MLRCWIQQHMAPRAAPTHPPTHSPATRPRALAPPQLLNKADLLSPEALDELLAWYRANCTAKAVLPISALEGRGLDEVRRWIQQQLPESPSLYPKVGG